MMRKLEFLIHIKFRLFCFLWSFYFSSVSIFYVFMQPHLYEYVRAELVRHEGFAEPPVDFVELHQ